MSGRKNSLLSYRTIIAGDMSTASVTSTVTNLQFVDDVGIQLNWTGSPVGSFAVQISADYAQDNQGNVQNAGNWVPLTLNYYNGSAYVTATGVPTSVGSAIYLDLTLLSAPWIRIVYTRSSGSGTLNAYITAKEI